MGELLAAKEFKPDDGSPSDGFRNRNRLVNILIKPLGRADDLRE
jgi:hypothetical protein